jgi:hypothetical protein
MVLLHPPGDAGVDHREPLRTDKSRERSDDGDRLAAEPEESMQALERLPRWHPDVGQASLPELARVTVSQAADDPLGSPVSSVGLAIHLPEDNFSPGFYLAASKLTKPSLKSLRARPIPGNDLIEEAGLVAPRT